MRTGHVTRWGLLSEDTKEFLERFAEVGRTQLLIRAEAKITVIMRP